MRVMGMRLAVWMVSGTASARLAKGGVLPTVTHRPGPVGDPHPPLRAQGTGDLFRALEHAAARRSSQRVGQSSWRGAHRGCRYE